MVTLWASKTTPSHSCNDRYGYKDQQVSLLQNSTPVFDTTRLSHDMHTLFLLITQNLTNNAFMHHLRHQYVIQKIPTKSVYGSLCTIANDGDKLPFAVLKSTRHPPDADEKKIATLQLDILHECVISYALQTLMPNASFHTPIAFHVLVNRHSLEEYIHIQPYIHGKTILQLFSTPNALDHHMPTLIKLMIGVAEALRSSQQACKFVHYDLHCDNVLFTSTGQVQCIDYGSAVCIHPQLGFIGNKWKAHKKTVMSLGANMEQSFLPLYDFYRYVTYFYIKHETCSKCHMQPLLRYLYKLKTQYVNIFFDPTLSTWLDMMFDDVTTDVVCKEYYTEHACHVPHISNGTRNGFLCTGSMDVWINDLDYLHASLQAS